MADAEQRKLLDSTRASVEQKIPSSWHQGRATPRGVAWHFKDPVEGRRMNLRAEGDSVQIVSEGRTIGMDGAPIDIGTQSWQIPSCAEGPGLGDRTGELASPYVRQVLRAQLALLADGQRHDDEWGPSAGADAWHRFDDAINDLYRSIDGPNGIDPHDAVGDSVLDVGEADAVAAVVSVLDNVLAKCGPTAPVCELLAHPDWPEVVALSLAAVQVFDIA